MGDCLCHQKCRLLKVDTLDRECRTAVWKSTASPAVGLLLPDKTAHDECRSFPRQDRIAAIIRAKSTCPRVHCIPRCSDDFCRHNLVNVGPLKVIFDTLNPIWVTTVTRSLCRRTATALHLDPGFIGSTRKFTITITDNHGGRSPLNHITFTCSAEKRSHFSISLLSRVRDCFLRISSGYQCREDYSTA